MIACFLYWIVATFIVYIQGMFVKTEALMLSDILIIILQFCLIFILWFLIFTRAYIEEIWLTII